jgi:hypothetical protein
LEPWEEVQGRFLDMPPERRKYDTLELQELLAIPKLITEPPRREMKLERGSWRNDMRLRSVEGGHDFRVFMRKSEEFPENFSIGLAYLPKDGNGEVVLLRCNGPHGEFNATFNASHPHYSFHVHQATEETIASGERPENHAETCSEFASYEEALQYFIRAVNIDDAAEYFPDLAQGHFRFEQEEHPL